MGFEVPRTNLAAFSLCPLFFISLCSLHSTCWPVTSQLPSAFKVALDRCTWGAGLPGLLANNSLNSRLGMQDGPAQSTSVPVLRFTGALALAQEPSWGELFPPLLFTQTLFRLVSPGAGGAREEGLWGPIQPAQWDSGFSFPG